MRTARLALPLLAAALAACGGVRAVQGRPSGRDGWLVYAVRDLRFEAPATWRASGDERRVALEAPGGGARLEISLPEQAFADERTCLAAAQEKLGAQQGALERARRHPTNFGGRPAQTLEADQGGWHVWALAACDGGVQYRVFFTASTPAPPAALEAWRTLLQSARLGGEV
ncbi:MAG TPA: hypothetical protein VF912_06880 [Anaeromyxobacter sp.]